MKAPFGRLLPRQIGNADVSVFGLTCREALSAFPPSAHPVETSSESAAPQGSGTCGRALLGLASLRSHHYGYNLPDKSPTAAGVPAMTFLSGGRIMVKRVVGLMILGGLAIALSASL